LTPFGRITVRKDSCRRRDRHSAGTTMWSSQQCEQRENHGLGEIEQHTLISVCSEDRINSATYASCPRRLRDRLSR
jgi:hypothetical protein